jgi:hypothetical protein
VVEEVVSVRRYLVVANQTLGGEQLINKIRECMAAGPCRFHVLVPGTAIGHVGDASVPVAPPASSGAFYGAESIPTTFGSAASDEEEQSRALAEARLTAELGRLWHVGAEADGEVGDADPLRAIREVLHEQEFDEIILSTLPPGASRWLRMDLPHRVERSSKLPVTHVVGPHGPT